MDAIRLNEAADLAFCSVRTISRAIDNGVLPAYRPGNKIILFKNDVIEWIKKDRQLKPKKDKRLLDLKNIHPSVKRLL